MSDELAQNLRRYRRAKGLSQEQLAHRASLSVGPIRKIEQGDDGVRMETLHAIARALGVKTSDLMAVVRPNRSSTTTRTVSICESCGSR
ncbi:helix-turn-helix transcriptional regulator [Streptomyces sp. SID2888]|uniref:helix-turn-helix domain-containing protein n=1 Tax=Streptomyces sp. SID2888 TaxID=2690256 RepID=UPI001F206C73|nr:helix-turn-helix transcriptional regulator [Streptomyces sp. SID2888]